MAACRITSVHMQFFGPCIRGVSSSGEAFSRRAWMQLDTHHGRQQRNHVHQAATCCLVQDTRVSMRLVT